MSSDQPPPAPAARFTRFAAVSTLTTLALTAACILAVLIAARYNLRLDSTATREHSLSPQTTAALASLDRPVDLILSANLQAADRAFRQRADDTLASFAEASTDLRVRRIDTGLAGALDAYARLVADLAQREADDIAQATDALDRALDDADHLAATLPDLAALLDTVADASPGAPDDWRNAANVIRRLAADLADAIRQSRPLHATDFAGTSLPQPDAVLPALAEPITALSRALATLQSTAAEPPDALPDAARPALRDAGELTGSLLETGAAIFDALRRAPRLDSLDVARLLRQRQAFVVAGTNATVALDVDALFPPADRPANPNAQDMIVSAIATASGTPQPTLVLVHTETEPLLDGAARLSPRAQASLGDLVRSLSIRRIGIAEWPVALDTPMPTRASLALDERTPIVWLFLGAPLASAENGIERIRKAGDAIRRLTDAGHGVLLTINPSDLPGVGEPNPVAAPLADFALAADSGRVIVARASSPSGPVYAAEHTIRRADTTHPIGAALDALATLLPSATPIDLLPTDAPVSRWPILTLEPGPDRWAEARWQSPPPAPGPGDDRVDEPFTVVVAAERRRAPTEPAALPGNTQRIVVVAAAQWYVDPITRARTTVEGRDAARFPGNRQLLSAAVSWLAGRDELIARASDVRDVPRIRPLTPTQLTAIRWLLIAGLPVLVLAAGAATRLLHR